LPQRLDILKVLIMKRILLMLVGVVMLGCVMSSCSKDESNKQQNPLIGTLWAEDDDAPLRLEFIDATTVSLWGSYQKPDTGTYTVSGNTVTFTGLESENYGTYKYISATFTNNSMIVSYTMSSSPNEIRTRRLYKQ
jgi:hypothetical protein